MTTMIFTLLAVALATFALSRIPVKGQLPILISLMVLVFLVVVSVVLKVLAPNSFLLP